MEYLEKEKKEVEERKKEIKNAIKAIKNTSASYIKDGMRSGSNILFFDSGQDFKFGIDSHYRLQVNYQFGNVKNKNDVLQKLTEELNELNYLYKM